MLSLLGFSDVLGWGPLATTFHLYLGLLYFCTTLLLKDALSIRRVIGGLGVLLVVTKMVIVASSALLSDEPLHGPVELICLVLGLMSILAARFLPALDPAFADMIVCIIREVGTRDGAEGKVRTHNLRESYSSGVGQGSRRVNRSRLTGRAGPFRTHWGVG